MIIPYQGLSGNYNVVSEVVTLYGIIPYQGLSGNYNLFGKGKTLSAIIPYQGLSGNYNYRSQLGGENTDYTIPRAIRELQPRSSFGQ